MENNEKYKKNKGGRPHKKNKRETTTGIRLNELERFIVRGKAKLAGLPLTTYIREMAINGIVKHRLEPEQWQFVRLLTGMANNQNQLAKEAHNKGALALEDEIKKVNGSLDTLLNLLLK